MNHGRAVRFVFGTLVSVTSTSKKTKQVNAHVEFIRQTPNHLVKLGTALVLGKQSVCLSNDDLNSSCDLGNKLTGNNTCDCGNKVYGVCAL